MTIFGKTTANTMINKMATKKGNMALTALVMERPAMELAINRQSP